MPKKQSLKTLKARLWTLTSKYVRLKASDHAGFAACVTCGIVKPWEDLQAGHWIPAAKGNAMRWDLRNIHPQCHRCNVHLGSNGPAYTQYMHRRYGVEECDEMIALSNTVRKIKPAEYELMIEQMAERLADLALRRTCDIPRVNLNGNYG